MKAKNTRLELRDQDIQKLIHESIEEYKEDYESTLERLIRGKIDNYDVYLMLGDGAPHAALRFYERYIDNE